MAAVRDGRPEDLEALLPLYDALYRELNGFGLAFTLSPEGMRGALSAQLRSKLCQVSVAEENGVLAGFLSAGILRMDRKLSLPGTRALGMIHDLYLSPEFRGRGLARALLDRAEDWLAGQGVTLVQCQVVEGNGPGTAFWARQGYAPTSTTRARILSPRTEEASHVVSPG